MEVILTDLARLQLNSVLDYVEEEYGERTAAKTLDRIADKLRRLLMFPESGTLDAKYSTSKLLVRHILINPNIFYYIVEEDTVLIIAVMHTKQSPRTVAATIRRFLQEHKR